MIVLCIHFLWLSDVEINSDIHWNSNIIFSWDVSNWASVSNSVFGNHTNRSFVITIAPFASWLHNTSVFTPYLFKSVHTIWDIQFPDTRALIVYHNHDWNSWLMLLRNKLWTIFTFVWIKLDKMGLSSHCSLCIIEQSILLGVEGCSTSLHILVWMHFY